jgi:hypothetical protein
MAESQIGKVVWIACRAAQSCEGQQCTVEMIRKINGSRMIRYRCLSCKHIFSILF